MAKRPKTASKTPLLTLAREMVFTYYTTKIHSSAKMARIFENARRKGLCSSPKQFRRWLVDEIGKSVDTIDVWLQK